VAISKIDPDGLNIGQIGGRRNLIINGAMQVAQRGTSSAGTGYRTVDRFTVNDTGTDELAVTQSQESDAPSGFSKSFQIEVTTAESTLGADEYLRIYQAIEGQNLQQLAYGTSSAKELTLSFWVKSSVTGTYAVALYIFDANRSVGATYTVNSADTWEYKTITLPADTSGSLPNDDNTEGAYLNWALSAGTDYTVTDNTSWDTHSNARFLYGQTADVASTLNATWQITGVQLEVGSVATPFEHRSYGEELALCQRYYFKTDSTIRVRSAGYSPNARVYGQSISLPTTMRASPTITLSNISYSGSNTAQVDGSRPDIWFFSSIGASDGSNSTTFSFDASAEL